MMLMNRLSGPVDTSSLSQFCYSHIKNVDIISKKTSPSMGLPLNEINQGKFS